MSAQRQNPFRLRPSAPEPRPALRIEHATVPVIGLIATAVFLYLIRNILLPFVLSLIVAYLCAPLIDWLTRRIRLPRWVAAVAALLAITACGTFLGWLLVEQISRDFTPAVSDLRASLAALLGDLFGSHPLELLGSSITSAQVADRIAQAAGTWAADDARLSELVQAGVVGLFGLLLTWVLLAYFLIGGPQIAQGAFRLIPPRRRALAARIWRELDPLLRRYFVGVIVLIAYASCVAYIGLGVVLGLEHAVVLALLTGVLELLPVAGPGLSAVLGGLAAIHQSAGAGAIAAYTLYAFALRISIDQVVGPLVLGKAARMNPVLLIFCYLVGGVLYGAVGVILAVPVALTVKVALSVLYEEPTGESV